MDLLKRLCLFIILWMVQILVLNHIHLFGTAIPLLYIYFVITFRRNTPKWIILLWSFTMGLAVDVFSNTPGLATGTLTLIAFLQPYLLELFIPRDSSDELSVSAATLGLWKFMTFSGLLIVLYCLIFFALEAFSFFDWIRWLVCAGTSAILTFILIIAIESVRKK